MGIAASAATAERQGPLVALAGQAIRRRDWPAAIAAADDLMVIAPQDTAAVTQALQAYLQAGDVTSAVQVAISARADWPRAPRLAELAMLALGRAGDRGLAVEAARAAGLGGFCGLRLAAVAADAFTKAGHPSEAIAALEAAGVRNGTDARAWYELARARQRLGDAPVDSLADARHALALAPGNLRAIELVARLHLDCDHPEAAINLLTDLPESRQNASVSFLLVEAYSAVGSLDLAATCARRLAADHLASQPMIRRLSAVLHRAGQDDLARDLYLESLAIRRGGLPDRLADGVATRMRGPATALPLQRLDWLWQVLLARNCAPADHAAWVREVTAVAAIDRLILDWMECRPDPGADLAALISGVVPAQDMVASALQDGKGVFIAAAHVGLLFGGLAALALGDLPMAFVASAPELGRLAKDGNLISTSTQDKGEIARALIRASRAGKVVAVAIDGAPARTGATYPLFDRQIVLSDFIPRLAWKSGTASFFPSVIWDGHHARLTLSALPSPKGFPSVEAFVAVWMRAFLDRLESLLLDHPGSARASGGFWGNIAL